MSTKDKGYMAQLDEEELVSEATKLLSEYGIDYVEGCSYCGDSNDIYCEIVGIFCEVIEGTKMTMLDSLDNSDSLSYATEVHALKSNSKNVGASKLAEIAYMHEVESKAGNLQYCREHWSELLDEWDYIAKGLCDYLWAMGSIE